MHRLSAAESVWAGRKFPVADPVTGKVNWPRQWPPERVARKRRELGDLEYSRQMLCEPRDDSTARFKRAWIEGCQELGRKRGIKLYRTLDDIPDAIWDRAVERAEEQLGGVPGGRVYTGVDLGVSQRAGSDLTVLFTILVHADATRQVLGIESGRWTAPEIIRRIVDTHNRYDSKVIVENVSAQDFLRQFATAYTHVPIVPFTTTARKKWHPRFGVESIATELENGKWWIPDDPEHKALRAWIREMLYYDPNGHTGDHLMAAWFAREGARRDERGSGKPRGVTARVL